jgi:hypothetical protein
MIDDLKMGRKHEAEAEDIVLRSGVMIMRTLA